MADILQMHDLKPAPGAVKDRIRASAVVKGPRVRPRPWRQGHQKRYPGSSGLRRWPAAAVHAPSEAAWLQEPVQEEYQVVQRGCSWNCSRRAARSPLPIWLPRRIAVRDGYPVKVLRRRRGFRQPTPSRVSRLPLPPSPRSRLLAAHFRGPIPTECS